MSMREDNQQQQPPFMDVTGELAGYGLDPFGAGSAGRPTGQAFHDNPGGMDGFDTNAWPIPTSVTSNSLCDGLGHNRKRRRIQSPAHFMPSPPISAPPWDLMTGDRLARTTNNSIIGEAMMKIYHDVMEGALSCWLVEHTCPYKSLPLTSSPDTPDHQQFGSFEDLHEQWGPKWSNRILRRVIKLDRTAHVLGLKKLSSADERKVTNALNSAVMAFTAQWAQSSQRSSARWPGLDGLNANHDFQPPDLDIGAEFDRRLQISFWNQARKALNDCSEIDSFRVAFAEIIFGQTQKYVEITDDQQDPLGPDKDVDTSEVVGEILRYDNQQIWVERATRRLHILRRRIELHDRQLRDKSDGEYSCGDAEHRRTLDLLFWLGVMFDTISAAMTERPVTVSDEDSSDMALSHPSTPSTSSTSNMADIWNTIITKDQRTKITSLRWPLSEKIIAQELTDATPVKVLLYRKITRLQTLIARNQDAATIEETIEDALTVYRHWQLLYNPLFSDCIKNHLLLSARIQGWYVCLLGHWLLATLLIVNLIQSVDQQGLGKEAEKRQQMGDHRAQGIREASVRMISDLAKASTPRHDNHGQLDGFHDAVNEGALLTEPWTIILIRTFSGAAINLLEDVRPVDVDTDLRAADRGNYRRCEDCVKALWYLGRKSDMARQVANVLAVYLQRSRFKVRK
ncbi:Regulatory protein alcR [Cytospora mali]|uniref:Regulatory protein alcR n=1 Tax=Cytospora mali TaxID=578113 RepID=A0A194UMN3_CYTMA|nr:Regulatory protein alcR [Valsa mali var. pyri (nom. inval.)]